MGRHDLDQASEHRAAVDAEVEREHHLDCQQLSECGLCREPGKRRVSSQKRQACNRQQHRLAAEPVGNRAADRIPDEVRDRNEKGHDQCPRWREAELLAETGCVHRDEVEGGRGQHSDHHAENDDAPIGDRRGKYLLRGRMLLHLQEFGRFLQRAAQEEDNRDNEAADKERDAPFGDPADGIQEGVTVNAFSQEKADDRRDKDRDLLTGRLERRVEAAIARRRNLGKINRDAAEFDAGGKPLYQPANQHNDRCGDADRCVSGAESNHHCSKRH